MTEQIAIKKFRFQNISAILTYKTHINKEEYIKWFTEKTKEVPKFIRLAHEVGTHSEEVEEYEHTHVVFVMVNKINTTSERYFDYEGIHPHIKALTTRRMQEDAKKYIAKEDPANSDLLVAHDLANAVWREASLQQALAKFVTKPSDAPGIIALYNNKGSDHEISEEDIPKQDWQLQLMERTKDKAVGKDRRKIIWVYDKQGGSGKTQFARYKLMTEPDKWFMSKDMGTSRDASTIIMNAISCGWNGFGCIIDLPRSAEQHARIYSYLESIKDGVVTSQKYNGTTKAFSIPHTIVFANWPPKLFALSRDRWEIYELKKSDKKDERGKSIRYLDPYKPSPIDFVDPDSNKLIDFN